MSEVRRGSFYGATAYLLWGVFPLYFPLLEPAGPVEILAHRIVWSLVVVLVVLAVTGSWGWVRPLARDRRALTYLGAASVFIAANWCTYIYGVTSGQVVETSLGYFINPLVMVLFGVLVLRERLRVLQWWAVGLGTVAVVVLTVDYGRLPWIALTLAFSFGSYALLKKRVGATVGAVQSLTVETAVLFLPALGFLLLLAARGDGQFVAAGPGESSLLASAGLATAVPLVLFASAARRVPLTTLGLMQYIAPVLQFLVGVLVYDEPMPASRLAGFGLVWAALALLTYESLTNRRRVRRRELAATRAADTALV